MSIRPGSILEGNSATIFGRWTKAATGEPLTQSDITSVTYGVWTAAGLQVTPAGTAMTKADVIFDSLFTWDIDHKGGNFRAVLSDLEDQAPGEYVVEVRVTETGGAKAGGKWPITVEDWNTEA